MDNIKQVVKDVRFLIATGCRNETIQSRIENFINEREQALRIHGASCCVCETPTPEHIHGIIKACTTCKKAVRQ